MFCEAGDTGDAGIFLVEVFLEELLFGGPDRGKNIGFAFVVACRITEVSGEKLNGRRWMVLLTVCTDAQVDLLLEAILLEGLGDTKDGIRRTFLDTGPCGRVHTGDAKDSL